MASGSSRTLMDFFKPAAAAKRIKLSSSSPDSAVCKSVTAHCHSESESHIDHSSEDDTTLINGHQKARMEFNRLLAKAKLNLKICSQKVYKAKGTRYFSSSFVFFFPLYYKPKRKKWDAVNVDLQQVKVTVMVIIWNWRNCWWRRRGWKLCRGNFRSPISWTSAGFWKPRCALASVCPYTRLATWFLMLSTLPLLILSRLLFLDRILIMDPVKQWAFHSLFPKGWSSLPAYSIFLRNCTRTSAVRSRRMGIYRNGLYRCRLQSS